MVLPKRPPRAANQQPTAPFSVVSYCPTASAVGTRVLLEGGNAVDAAVATGIALAVTYPQAGNIGGGGFMTIARTGDPEVYFLDYRETAPKAIRPAAFIDPDGRRSIRSVKGALPVGIPGTIAGFAEALRRFGTMGWDRLLGLSIDLAERGFWLTTRQAAYMNRYAHTFGDYASTRACFPSHEAGGYLPGTQFCQPELAQALRRLADAGPEDFYRGTTADCIVSQIAEDGGVLSHADLADYRAIWRPPYHCQFAGRSIYTAPLPSGGGLVIGAALGLLESSGFRDTPRASQERYAILARAFRVAFALRHRFAGDPDHLPEEVVDKVRAFAEQSYGANDLAELERAYVHQDTALLEPLRLTNTTHFSVLDAEGNAVSNTYSLNTLFGSKLVVGGCGFLLNNCLDDFRIGDDTPNWYGIIDGARNALAPERRAVGSMAPTIVRNPNSLDVEMVIGGSGGPMIATLVTQIVAGVFGDQRALPEAVAEPRVHHQYLKAELKVEKRIPPEKVLGIDLDNEPVVPALQLGIAAGIHKNENGQLSSVLDNRFATYQLQ